MVSSLSLVLEKIKDKNPKHYLKLESNLKEYEADYEQLANSFLDKYISYLDNNQLSLDFGIDCYLHMIEDMLEERTKFIRTGKYSNTTFEDVEKQVYSNSAIMTYHMHGLVLAQFLWFDQYERLLFFTENFRKYLPRKNKYLEIGGGHGLYIDSAIDLVPEIQQFDMVDISQSSLDLAKGIVTNDAINYSLKNIFDFSEDEKYDFVTMGEVLEHVENPSSLLLKIYDLLEDDGVCYITTPINAPMIDHIYLFNNDDEIKELFDSTGFEIVEDKKVISEKISDKLAKKFKVPVMYAAFLKKKIKNR